MSLWESPFNLISIIEVIDHYAIVNIEDVSVSGVPFYALVMFTDIRDTSAYKTFTSISREERFDNVITFIKDNYTDKIDIIKYVYEYYDDVNLNLREVIASNVGYLCKELKKPLTHKFESGALIDDKEIKFFGDTGILRGSDLLLFGDIYSNSNSPVILEKSDEFKCIALYFDKYIPNQSKDFVDSYFNYSILCLGVPLDSFVVFINGQHRNVRDDDSGKTISLYEKLVKDYKGGKIDTKKRRWLNKELLSRHDLDIKEMFFAFCINCLNTVTGLQNLQSAVSICLREDLYRGIERVLWNGNVELNENSTDFRYLGNSIFSSQFRKFVTKNYIKQNKEWLYHFIDNITGEYMFSYFVKYNLVRETRGFSDCYIIKFLAMVRYNRVAHVSKYTPILEKVVETYITSMCYSGFFKLDIEDIKEDGTAVITFNEHTLDSLKGMNITLKEIYDSEPCLRTAVNAWLYDYKNSVTILDNEIDVVIYDKFIGDFDVKAIIGAAVLNMYIREFIRFDYWDADEEEYDKYYTLGDIGRDTIFNPERIELFKVYLERYSMTISAEYNPATALPKLSHEGSIFADMIFDDIMNGAVIGTSDGVKNVDISVFNNKWNMDSSLLKQYGDVIIDATVFFLITSGVIEIFCGGVCDKSKFRLEHDKDTLKVLYQE